MRKFLFAAAAFFAAVSLAPTAKAAPDLAVRIFEDNVLQSGMTQSSSSGSLVFTGSTSLFSFVSVIAAGAPLIAEPDLTVQSTSISSRDNFSGTHSLRIEVTQTDIAANSAQVSGTLAQLANSFTQNFLVGSGVKSVTSSNYISASNNEFARSLLIGRLKSALEGGPTADSGLIYSEMFNIPGALFSETVVIEAVFTRGGATLTASSQIVGVPEPASLALFGMGLLGMGLVRQRRLKA